DRGGRMDGAAAFSACPVISALRRTLPRPIARAAPSPRGMRDGSRWVATQTAERTIRGAGTGAPRRPTCGPRTGRRVPRLPDGVAMRTAWLGLLAVFLIGCPDRSIDKIPPTQ